MPDSSQSDHGRQASSWISRISDNLGEVYLREVGIAETGWTDENHADAYFRESLSIALKTLDNARHALQNVSNYSEPVEATQARIAIEALSDEDLWYELLKSSGLEDNSPARTAARDLAERIAKMSPYDVPRDSLGALLADIELLRQFIASALREAGVLSPSLVQECMNATSSIGTEVIVGLAAMLASSEAAGTTPARIAVICTAIGLGAGAATKQIWDRITRAAKAQTVESQLQKNHHELLDTVADLMIFLNCPAGDNPASTDQLELLSSVQLAARLQVNHIEQLAASTKLLSRRRYCQILSQLKEVLAQIPGIASNRDCTAAQEARNQLGDAHSQIVLFTHRIDHLKPSWRSRS